MFVCTGVIILWLKSHPYPWELIQIHRKPFFVKLPQRGGIRVSKITRRRLIFVCAYECGATYRIYQQTQMTQSELYFTLKDTLTWGKCRSHFGSSITLFGYIWTRVMILFFTWFFKIERFQSNIITSVFDTIAFT